ncbi:hypothetical protein [Polaribacter cellanae]|uniref:Uncharacterized protein n=1 Tax=Polaribacter cellanae TaxID=2818493 RepID=A0A975CPY0_9FLAO|nr:hypothetical protein [Polaribacter cellanae]QTE21026.1 hypothetical protein J3359_09195 [Polaribacter cellanae]
MVYLQYIPDYKDINLLYSEKELVRFEQGKAFLKLKINSILVKGKFIDEISVLRNEELGRYLMRRISYKLNQIPKIKLKPYEVIQKIEKENFEKSYD